MGVRAWLARRAVRATRVIVVEAGDGFAARVAVERALAARGWLVAESPASADALLVAGRATDELAEVVERLWDAMPGPRARAAVTTAAAAPAALDELAERLTDAATQAEDAAARTAPDLGEGMDHGDMDDEGMDHGDMDDEGMDHGDMDDEGMDHGDMDHGDMDMAPDGIPLAEGSEDDRDGLEMDALPVRLGPVLRHWPASLVLDVTLHGDLVTEARAHLLDDAAAADEADPGTRAARRCDEVAAVLALVAWEEGAALARAARDQLLAQGGGDARALLVELRHRVEHSRLLRWSLAGVGQVSGEEAHRLGLPAGAAGDCRDRLLHLVDAATAAARAYAGTVGAGATEGSTWPALPVTACGPLVRGHDLSVARLLVATLGSPVPSTEAVRDA